MRAFVVLSACLLLPGCLRYTSTTTDGGMSVVPPGVGVGGACGGAACRMGLVCTAGTCQPGHATADGQPCVLNAECTSGSVCGPARVCVKGGAGKSGDSCGSDVDCGPGLRCNLVGFGTACQPDGTADVGGACQKSGDCLGGLACANGVCAALPPNPGGGPPLGIPTFAGATCEDESALPPKAWFRVPRGKDDGDFYRLPFPNDVRTKAGHPDYTGHPTPGASLLGFDPVDRYLRHVEQNVTGSSTNPTVIFRFSAKPDFASLKGDGVVSIVDIDPRGGGDALGFQWNFTTQRNQYLCGNNLVLRTYNSMPLAEGHIHAVIIKTGVQDDATKALMARDADFAALVAPAPPSDPALTAAWNAYKPLRDFAARKPLDLSTVLVAAVFTVGTPSQVALKLPAAVRAAPAPTARAWVRCGDAPSPCPQASGDRACGAVDPAFDELHALVSLPIFQKGSEPYLEPADGGDLQLGGDGTPQLQRMEDVCLSLTVPKAAPMPPGGWPLVLYAHGTGGSFRSNVLDLGTRLATVTASDGRVLHVATLGIDQVEHGTRRGASTQAPSNLFYNFANPAAARGNTMQGAADQVALLRLVAGLQLPANQSPTKSEIRFGRTAVWGHSQGASEASVALPYTTGAVGVVLSGQGAGLIYSLLDKQSPVDIAAALPVVLQDAQVKGNAFHPVLAVLQTDLDLADPLNHAAAMALAPVMHGLGKHVFQPYGQGDTYAPPATEITYVRAALLGVISAPMGVAASKELTDLGTNPAPFGANLQGLTAVTREYAPAGYDGHFVAFQNPDARVDVDRFLADVLESGAPPKVGR